MGTDLAARHAVPGRTDLLQLLLSLARGRSGAGGSASTGTRAVRCAIVTCDELDRPRPWANLSGRCERFSPRELPGPLAADRVLYTGAFLRARRGDVPSARPEVASRVRLDGRQALMSLLLRLLAWSTAALLAVPAAAEDLVVRAPAGAVKGE